MFRTRLGRIWKEERGYTLIELLAVMVILIILSLMAMPVYAGASSSSKYATSQTRLSKIQYALDRYYIEHSHYPRRLGLLAEEGLIQHSLLETPWSTAGHPRYYFYAVDDVSTEEDDDGNLRDQALGYALGDPGPRPSKGCDPNQKTTSLNDTDETLPCGKSPSDDAWSFGRNATLTANCRILVDLKVHDTVLASYYSLSQCRKWSTEHDDKPGNDLVTEQSVPIKVIK